MRYFDVRIFSSFKAQRRARSLSYVTRVGTQKDGKRRRPKYAKSIAQVLNTRPYSGIFFTVTLSILSRSASAADPVRSQLADQLLRTTGMLLLVVGLILVMAWLARRLQGNTNTSSRTLQMIETLPLGRNEKLCIVKVGSRYQVLGITSQSVTLLHTLEDPDLAALDKKNQGWQWAQQFLQNRSSQMTVSSGSN